MGELPNTQTVYMTRILETYGTIEVSSGSGMDISTVTGMVILRLINKNTIPFIVSSDSYDISISKLYRRLIIIIHSTVVDIEGGR